MKIGKIEAITRGLKTYFTGEPCIHGHVSPRLTGKSNECLACRKERRSTLQHALTRKAWRNRPEVRQRHSEAKRKHRQSHVDEARAKDRQRRSSLGPETKAAKNAKQKAYRDNPANRSKARQYATSYGLAKKERMAGRAKPDRCEVCGSEGKIVFDHCHTNQKFRGWICDRCNKVLGLVRDDPKVLIALQQYLPTAAYECESCGEPAVYGAEELLLHV